MDAKHPYQWVCISGLSNYRMKEPERTAFALALRNALGSEAKSWDADGVDDADEPLGRFVTTVSDKDRAALISSPEALFAFASEHFTPLFQLADTIERECPPYVLDQPGCARAFLVCERPFGRVCCSGQPQARFLTFHSDGRQPAARHTNAMPPDR